MRDIAGTHITRAALRTRSRTGRPAFSPLVAGTTRQASVPGACPVVQVRASHLTCAHVIRLESNQGTIWQEKTWRTDVHPSRQATARPLDVRHAWREVLGAYTDRASLEAEFGSQLDRDLASLAEEAWDNRHRAMVIRVLIHEVSDASEISEMFVILNLHDRIGAQSLPAAGMEREWGGGLSDQLAPGMLDLLVRAAGELWDSTGGHDPYDVLSRRRRNVLDRAAALYRAAAHSETGDGSALEAAAAEAAR
jgi:hypothetical protein